MVGPRKRQTTDYSYYHYARDIHEIDGRFVEIHYIGNTTVLRYRSCDMNTWDYTQYLFFKNQLINHKNIDD